MSIKITTGNPNSLKVSTEPGSRIVVGPASGGGAGGYNPDIYNSWNAANAAFLNSNAAFNEANSANVLAYNTGIGANAWSNSVGSSGNNYTNTVGTAGNNYTNSVGTAGNNYTNSVGIASNSYSSIYIANVAIGSNSYAGFMANSANAFTIANVLYQGASSNNWANTVGTAGNNYSISVSAAANGWANTVGIGGNNYAAVYIANVAIGANTFAGILANNVNANVQFGFTSANSYAGFMANSANIYAGAMANAANANAQTGHASANGWANTVGVAGNNYSNLTFYTIANGTAAFGFANTVNTFAYGVAVNAKAAFDKANTAGGSMDYPYVNTSTQAANNYAGTMANSANIYAGAMANAANAWANTKLSNTNNVVFNGSLQIANTIYARDLVLSNSMIANISGNVYNLSVTNNVFIGGSLTNVTQLIFNTGTNISPSVLGTLTWSQDDDTLHFAAGPNTGSSILHIGQDVVYLVKNQSGSTITKGTACMFAGTLGASGRILVQPAITNGTYPSKYFMGLAINDIANGNDGFVMHFGKVRQFDTSMFSSGDLLFNNPAVAGGLQNTAPIAPNNKITVAAVIYSDKNNGTVMVRPTFSSFNDDTGGTQFNSITGGDVLYYVAANNRWENSQVFVRAYNTTNSAYNMANSANVLAYNTGIGANNWANTKLANTTGTFAGDLTVTGNVIANKQAVVYYQPSSTVNAAIHVLAANTNGGTGYADFFKLTNISGTSNPSKWIRLTTDGTLQVLSNNYSTGLFSITDSGDVSAAGNITSSGIQSGYNPNRPAFRVTGSGTTNNLGTTINGTSCLTANNWSVDYNTGSYLTGANGVFIAPVAGLYQINIVGRNSGYTGGYSQIAVVKNSSGGNGSGGTVICMVEWAANSSMDHCGASTIIKMNAGDNLTARVLAGQINFDGNDNWSVAYIG